MRAIAGGSIAIVLLGLYVYLILIGCVMVVAATKAGNTANIVANFNDVMAQALSVIGGLVSAFIIAELAITKQGTSPAARMLNENASHRAKIILRWVTWLYLAVWLAFGLAAFVIGMRHPKVLPVLTNVGQAWLGLAVAPEFDSSHLNSAHFDPGITVECGFAGMILEMLCSGTFVKYSFYLTMLECRVESWHVSQDHSLRTAPLSAAG